MPQESTETNGQEIPQTKARLVEIIRNNLKYERLDTKTKLLELAKEGNELAKQLVNTIVDRGFLLQQLNQTLILLGQSWEEMAELEREEDGEFLRPDSDLSQTIFWFLHNVDMLEPVTNRARIAGFDAWPINDVGEEVDELA